VTLYWRFAHLVKSWIPQDWIRAWSVDYARSINATMIEPVLDFTIVPHKHLSIRVRGEIFPVHPGDTIRVDINKHSPVDVYAEPQ
jgi:hypothetical protein